MIAMPANFDDAQLDMKVLIRMAYIVARKHAPLADFTVPYLLLLNFCPVVSRSLHQYYYRQYSM
jgi:hypothetical protein